MLPGRRSPQKPSRASAKVIATKEERNGNRCFIYFERVHSELKRYRSQFTPPAPFEVPPAGEVSPLAALCYSVQLCLSHPATPPRMTSCSTLLLYSAGCSSLDDAIDNAFRLTLFVFKNNSFPSIIVCPSFSRPHTSYISGPGSRNRLLAPVAITIHAYDMIFSREGHSTSSLFDSCRISKSTM